jgi:hypothetical protein
MFATRENLSQSIRVVPLSPDPFVGLAIPDVSVPFWNAETVPGGERHDRSRFAYPEVRCNALSSRSVDETSMLFDPIDERINLPVEDRGEIWVEIFRAGALKSKGKLRSRPNEKLKYSPTSHALPNLVRPPLDQKVASSQLNRETTAFIRRPGPLSPLAVLFL